MLEYYLEEGLDHFLAYLPLMVVVQRARYR
jgi:hypothetical protein